jgi:ferrous iron transport protein A
MFIDNRSQSGPRVRLDHLSLGTVSRIAAIDWDSMTPADARRLREFGFDEGVAVQPLHRGMMRGPLACRVGRMTVAIRASLAAAILVDPA